MQISAPNPSRGPSRNEDQNAFGWSRGVLAPGRQEMSLAPHELAHSQPLHDEQHVNLSLTLVMSAGAKEPIALVEESLAARPISFGPNVNDRSISA